MQAVYLRPGSLALIIAVGLSSEVVIKGGSTVVLTLLSAPSDINPCPLSPALHSPPAATYQGGGGQTAAGNVPDSGQRGGGLRPPG